MRPVYLILTLGLVAATLAGCGGSVSSAAAQESVPAAAGTPEPYTSAVLVTTYPNALPASSQLALGTLRLEGTQNAVTPDQAKTLLPLWEAIQGGALKTDAETNAVLRQIEGAMTPEQLAAIAAMQLTFQDVTAYAQANGLSLGFSPEAMATRQAGGGQGGQGSGGVTDAQRQAYRATAQAGGSTGGQGGQGFGNLTDAQRASMRATAQAGGFGGPRGGGGGGFLTVLAKPVVDLLNQRAAG
jgi:hypothetical protein